MDSRTVIPFILVALAVYRVSYLVTAESGPFDMFARWRRYLLAWEQKRGKPHWIIDGFMCQLCVSFWLGFAGALFVPFTDAPSWVIMGLALSTPTVLINKTFSALADLATGKRHY